MGSISTMVAQSSRLATALRTREHQQLRQCSLSLPQGNNQERKEELTLDFVGHGVFFDGPKPGLGQEEGNVGSELDPLPERGVHVEGGIDKARDGLEVQWVIGVSLVLHEVP